MDAVPLIRGVDPIGEQNRIHAARRIAARHRARVPEMHEGLLGERPARVVPPGIR